VQKACFQLAMVSDYRTARSYIMFNYKNMGWTTQRNTVQGFQASRTHFTNIYTSLSPLAYRLPDLRGNNGTAPLFDCSSRNRPSS